MSYGDSPRRTIFFLIIGLFIAILLGYALFEARLLIEGPQITLNSPSNGTATSSGTVVISGLAENISFLTINDAPAYTDESGRFSLTLSPPAGYTVFTVAGVDRFGRRTSKQVAIDIVNFCPISNV